MQDYVMRLIQQVAQMLAAILGHRNAGREAEAREDLERLCVQTAGLPLSMIRQASPEALRTYLESGGPRRLMRDILLAELLLQDAEMNLRDGDAEARVHSRAHAFCLIFDAMNSLTGEDAAHYRPKLDELAAELTGSEVDYYTAEKLRLWDKQQGSHSGLSGSVLLG